MCLTTALCRTSKNTGIKSALSPQSAAVLAARCVLQGCDQDQNAGGFRQGV